MTDSKCESAISKFCDFVSNDVKKNSIEFHDFDKASYRLVSSTFKVHVLRSKRQKNRILF